MNNQSNIISPQRLHPSHDPQSITAGLSGTLVRSSNDRLLLLLVALALLLAGRVVFHVRHRSQRPPASSSVTTINHPPKALVEIAEQLLIDFRERSTAKHAIYVDFEHHLTAHEQLRKDNTELKRKNAHLTAILASMNQERKDGAFTGFRERLLLTNEVWRHEKEIKILRAALQSTQKAMRENAFAAFCDRLVLTNKVWKQEGEIKELHDGEERLKRARIAGIKRIAGRMVLDVRKESLIEELVKDLIEEVEVSKREITTLQDAHKREIEKINSEWVKDYRKLARESEKLKLGQQARLVEQEVANEMEESLLDSLRSSKRKAEDLEDRLWEYKKLLFIGPVSEMSLTRVYGSSTASDVEEDISEDDFDLTLSDSSTSSTCVANDSWTGVNGKSAGLGGAAAASMMDRACAKGAGTRSSAAHPQMQAPIERSFCFQPRSLASPSPAIPAKGLPTVFRFDPVLLVRSDPPSALAVKRKAARVDTSSGQPFAGRRSTKSVPTRLPLRSSRTNKSRAPVSAIDSDLAGRSVKRVKFDLR